jgi:transducin (beta)-like 1
VLEHDDWVRDSHAVTDAPCAQVDGHTRAVLTLAFNPAGSLLVSGAGDNTCRLWGVRG